MNTKNLSAMFFGLGLLLPFPSAVMANDNSSKAAPIISADVKPVASNTTSVAVGYVRPPLPPIQPLFDFHIRDVSICLGPDHMYYLTGTTHQKKDENLYRHTDGVRVWKSPDLKNWEPLGLVWSFATNTTWQKTFTFPGVITPKEKAGRLALWAPEIHYFKGTFWIAYCVVRDGYNGTGVLKSTSGKPEGPYVDIKPEGPLTREIDASLFVDDDGKVYFLYQNGKIARMKDDMSGLAEKPKLLHTRDGGTVGFEGVYMFKANGRYHLMCAGINNKNYDCMAASSEHLEGPYGDRYLAIPHGGHNVIFKDFEGHLWSTIFGSNSNAPIRERPAILRIEIGKDNRIKPLMDLKQ